MPLVSILSAEYYELADRLYEEFENNKILNEEKAKDDTPDFGTFAISTEERTTDFQNFADYCRDHGI